MKLSEAEKASERLGMLPTVELTEETINEAYRAAVRRVHPDSAVDDVDAATALTELKRARDILKAWLREQSGSPHCGMCGGTGFVRSGFGVQPCTNASCAD